MKNLLYFAAFAVAFTSCSVESTQEENSMILNDTNFKAPEAVQNACNYVKLTNNYGETRGTIEPFLDYDKSVIIIRLTTYDWKIKTSKIYFGTKDKWNSTKPGLFETGNYSYNESFNGNIYIANYVFDLADVDADFGITANLNVSNDTQTEVVKSVGVNVDGKETKDTFVSGFVKDCL